MDDEIVPYGLAKSRRTAEPDARRLPLRHGCANAVGIESSIFPADQHMQAYMGGLGIGREFVDGSLFEIRRRMEQVDLLFAGHPRQLLQAGDEGGDADAGADPYLARASVAEIEAAIRSFHRDGRIDLQAIVQLAG